MITLSSTLSEHLYKDFVYDLLVPEELDLCVDVGAARGEFTRLLRSKGAHNTKVVAFEPFPGNWKFFEQATLDLEGVSLVRSVVGDREGFEDFFVRDVATGREPGWEGYEGYSSLGRLAPGVVDWLAQMFLLALSSITGRRRMQRYKVPSTTLDSAFPDQSIDFLKIDVQGAEQSVLRGAARLLAQKRIQIAYVEWSGDSEILSLLEASGFGVFDSTFVGTLGGDLWSRCVDWGFSRIGSLRLSTGKEALHLVYRGDAASLPTILTAINEQRGTWLQTDLIAVQEDRAEDFVSRIRSLRAAESPKT